MTILKHKSNRRENDLYGIVTLALFIGAVIGITSVLSFVNINGTAPVFAQENVSASTDIDFDYGDIFAENPHSLHQSYVNRLRVGDDAVKKGTLVIRLNSLEYQGSAWGLRNGRVDFIKLGADMLHADLGRPNPEKTSDTPIFQRPLDAFEEDNIVKLSKDKPVIIENIDGELRMLGLIPDSAIKDEQLKISPSNAEAGWGVFSYHFTEIADD